MSRTELDAATLAKALRRMAGDGSVEWVTGPIQASVLLDVADLMDEDDKLRKLIADVHEALRADKAGIFHKLTLASMEDDMRELGMEVDE